MVSPGGNYFHKGCFQRCHLVDKWFDQVAQLLSYRLFTAENYRFDFSSFLHRLQKVVPQKTFCWSNLFI